MVTTFLPFERIVVTGASSGIGKAIMEAHPLRAIGISRHGPTYSCDMTDVGDIDELLERFGKSPDFQCGVLVLNHGIMRFDERVHCWDILRTNLWSYWKILEHQKRTGCPVIQGGSIILNASVSGVIGDEDLPLYSASKAAVINLVRSYAKALMSCRIRVNAFSCGFFKTNLAGGGPTPTELVEKIPMKREAEPQEILPIVDALIRCEYITGQNIVVDGGLSL